MDYFFLEKELKFLENLKVFSDGTFYLLKNVPYSQMYILSVNITNMAENTTFSYPFSFGLTKSKSGSVYREMFFFGKKISRDHGPDFEAYAICTGQ